MELAINQCASRADEWSSDCHINERMRIAINDSGHRPELRSRDAQERFSSSLARDVQEVRMSMQARSANQARQLVWGPEDIAAATLKALK